MSYKIGSVSGNRLEDGSVGTDALATDAVTNAKMADSAIGSAEIVDASIVGGDLAADIAITTTGDISAAAGTFSGNMVIQGDLSVTGNTSSISLEEVQVDQAKIILNREDTTNLSALSGNVGVIVKGGEEQDLGMIFKSDAGGTVRFAKDPANLNSAIALECGNVSASSVFGSFFGDVTGNVTGSSGSCTGNAATASALQTARTIGGVSFDGSANVSLPGVDSPGNQSTSGNAATATKLAATKLIAGQAFDGSANITIASSDLSDAGSISAASADALSSARTITLAGDLSGSVSFDGSADVTLTATVAGDGVALGTDTTGNYVQSLACDDDAIAVSNGVAEGGAATLAVHGVLENAVDAISGADYSFSQKYMVLYSNAAGTATTAQAGSVGLTMLGADSAPIALSALSLSSTLQNRDHGDLSEVAGVALRLRESSSAILGSAIGASAMAYKSFYSLECAALSEDKTFILPEIAPMSGDTEKAKDGMCMKIKINGLASGRSITISPSATTGAQIDGAASFVLNEDRAAVTLCAQANTSGAYHWSIV
ncbi:MAG: hypothetical protein CL678_02080 [Bdellovibrionaceae bacterium]|nr:hypothetical protein [Pseudobdellovibrionaceae bacterium]|tara:strand:+ start:9847 stop:11481 length:1635 start_codon:yes stop_codon:yes gene_type:complete